MELQQNDYNTLLCHIDDLRKTCEKLKVNLSLLEIPINNATTYLFDDLMESSSESSSSSDYVDE